MDVDAVSNAMDDLTGRLTAAQADRSSLDRVFHRLALIDSTDRLQTVLDKLLPRLLQRIGDNQRAILATSSEREASSSSSQQPNIDGYGTRNDNHDVFLQQQLRAVLQEVHEKLVHMLSHIMKRVRDDQACQLPCFEIVQLLVKSTPAEERSCCDRDSHTSGVSVPSSRDPAMVLQEKDDSVNPFTINLALAFVTLGLPRCSILQVERLLPTLLLCQSTSRQFCVLLSPPQRSQSHQFAHLLLRVMERIVQEHQQQHHDTAYPLAKMGSSQLSLTSTATSTDRNRSSQGPSTTTSLEQQCSYPPLDLARYICTSGKHELAAAAVFDLCLDVVLYQPVAVGSTANASVMPPPGLSQAGHDALRSGSSATARDWVAEMAPRARLVQLKRAVLDWIAPRRQFHLFLQGSGDALGWTRTVALLVVATGEPQIEIADLAATILKMHLDSVRTERSSTATKGGDHSNDGANSIETVSSPHLGQPLVLACTLLSLCLGQASAESLLTAIVVQQEQQQQNPSSSSQEWNQLITLGTTDGSSSSSYPVQLIMSTKRRPVSEGTACAIFSFVAHKILDDHPQLFISHPAGSEGNDQHAAMIVVLGRMILQVVHKLLEPLSASRASGLSISRAKPYVAAAHLLQSWSIRVTAYYGAIGRNGTTKNTLLFQLQDLLTRTMTLACGVLRPVTMRHIHLNGGIAVNSATTIAPDGSLDVRDACYGVVSTVARSHHGSTQREHDAGSGTDGGSITSNWMSIEIVALLFQCAAHEEEQLRPRAVAALDSMLMAYVRIYTRPQKEERSSGQDQQVEMEVDPVGPSMRSEGGVASVNPWAPASGAEENRVIAVAESRMDASTMANQDHDASQAVSRALLPLLWNAAQSHQPKASRVGAARWSSALMKPLDLPRACHLLCFLSGDVDDSVHATAREGLGLSQFQGDGMFSEELTTANRAEQGSWPDFADFVDMLLPDNATNDVATVHGVRVQRFWDFSFAGMAATIRFGLHCLLNDLYGGDDRSVEAFTATLTTTLASFLNVPTGSGAGSLVGIQGRSSIQLLDEAAFCLLNLLEASIVARNMLVRPKSGSFHIRELEQLALEAPSSRARKDLAAACGALYKDDSLWSRSVECSLEEWVKESELDQTLSRCAGKMAAVYNQHVAASPLHGSAFLSAHVVRAIRHRGAQSTSSSSSSIIMQQCWKLIGEVLAALGRGTLHTDDTIGNTCADCITIALSYDGLDAPSLHPSLYKCSETLLSQVASTLNKFGHSDSVNAPRVTKVARAAGVCLAATTTGAGFVHENEQGEQVQLGPARLQCAWALFDLLGSLAFRKDEELAIAVGEALALYADAFSPDDAVWSHSDQAWDPGFDDDVAKQLPPHDQVLYMLLRKVLVASSPHKKTSCAPALLAVVARAAKGVNFSESYAKRALYKTLASHLEEIQQAFILLLSDPKSKHFPRECCCLGLAACRGLLRNVSSDERLASDELNARLLRAFGQTTNHGGSALMETESQAAARRMEENGGTNAGGNNRFTEPFGLEGEVGGASGIGEAALGAYREMASASVALGRHDVLYGLLLLSASHPFWSSKEAQEKYSAASLLGDKSFVGTYSSTNQMREALRPHLGKLIPKILRACNDPNKLTREQMTSLWIGLTGGGADSRLVITQHLLSTIDVLLEDSSSKLWRARVGACGALAEVIVGREWSDLGGGGPVLDDDDLYTASMVSAGTRLLRLWRTATRAIDDVRGGVRESGEALARAVKALTLRLADPAMRVNTSGKQPSGEELGNHESAASAAAATALRWLIKHGLNQRCAEAVGICLSALVDIVEVVRPRLLEPILPDLIRLLLMAVSGLEPAALNYLQLRASDQDSLERLRLQLAQTGPLAAAVTKCLDILPYVDISTQQKVVPELDTALRLSTGFATRAATADATSKLCSMCPAAFRFSSSSSANPSVRLLRAFYFASERERGLAAKDRMIHALGNLAALCPGSSVRSLAIRACDHYNASTGNSDDPVTRRASAAALRAIAVRATSHFADGGNADIWTQRVLPVAFLGRKDSDPKIASLWNDVWEEGGAACIFTEKSSSKGFGVSLEERLTPFLVVECVRGLKDVAWSRRVSAANALMDLCNLGILAPPARGLQSTSSSPPNEAMMKRAQQRAVATSHALTECLRLLVKPRIWIGKTVVLEAAVLLASGWCSALVDENADEKSLLGWTGSGRCPWRPVAFATGEAYEWDLFIGDRWFADQTLKFDEDDGDLTSAPSEAMNVDEGEQGKIDFHDCDEILGADYNRHAGNVLMDAQPGVVVFKGLCRLLLEHALPTTNAKALSASEELLPYRAASFRCLRDLLRTNLEHMEQRQELFRLLSPRLVEFIMSEMSKTEDGSKEPPVLIAAALEALGATIWKEFGSNDDRAFDKTTMSALGMGNLFQQAGGKLQPAWTVREAAALSMAQLAMTCHKNAIRKPALVNVMIGMASHTTKDRKYWRVRLAGLTIVHRLVSRVGSSYKAFQGDADSALIFESLLPHKEVMLRLCRSCLSDSEAKVTALSSDVLSFIAWWP